MNEFLHSAGPLLRLVGAALLFGVSLLSVLPSPNLPLFYLAVGATEYGHWFALGSAALAASGLLGGTLMVPALCLALAACLLFLSPLIRAVAAGPQIAREFQTAFPGFGKSRAVRFWNAWSLTKQKSAPIESRSLSEEGGLSLYFFRAATDGSPAPCVLVVHSGSWESGTPREFAPFHRALAARGFAVAAVKYRLAPQWQWPAQREDVFAAVRHLKRHHKELGIDPQNIVLLGRSAGGQIAEAAAYAMEEPGLRGCIAFYAPADLHFAYRHSTSNDILDSHRLLTQYLGGTPEQASANYNSASSYGLVTPHTVPTLLLHGERDELVWVRQSQRLATRLAENGVPHYFVRLPWATHGFDHNLHGPGGQIALWAVENFLHAVTGGR